MALAFDSISLKALTEKLDNLTVGEKPKKPKKTRKKNASKVTQGGPLDNFIKPADTQKQSEVNTVTLPPWDSSPECSPVKPDLAIR